MVKHNESGRSMIELIGVLCIMGLLTVAGIGLYSYGMDETIAQNTYEEVQQRAVTSLERFKDRRYNFDARPVANETSYGYTITVAQHASNREYIVVNVTGVSEGVCKHIVRKAKKTTEKFLPAAGLILNTLSYQTNELTDSVCPVGGSINMAFLFHRSRQVNHDASDVLSTCSSASDCLQRVGDLTACLKCDSSTRLCVQDDDKCAADHTCHQTAGTSYPKCYKTADISSDYPCGTNECLRLVEGVCVPDDSLCIGEATCGGDGFCTTN